MRNTIRRFDESIPLGILLFTSLAMGLFFVFNSPISFILIAVLACLPAILYLLFYRRKYFFPILVFLIPLSVSMDIGGGTKVDFPAELLLGIFTALILIYWLVNSKISRAFLFHPVSILIFIELIWMLICSVNSELPMVSYKRCLVRFSFVSVFYILFSQWMENPKAAGKLFLIYAAACVVPVIHGMIFHAKFNFSPVSAYLMPRPFFSEHTIYGAALAFLIPMLIILALNAKEFGIRSGKFALLILLTVLIATGEFLSFSRAAWVSLGLAFVFRLLIYFRVKLWMILLIISISGFIAYQNSNTIIDLIKRNEAVSKTGGISEHLMSVTNLQSDASNLERINRWKCAIRMVKEKPITGFGPGTYQFEYGQFQSRADMTRISTFRGTNGHAHSEFFNALSETGIPGSVFYLLLLFSVIALGLRVIYHSVNKQEKAIALGALLGLITFYVHGFFNAFLDTDKIAILVFVSIAILVHINIQQHKKSKSVSGEFLSANEK